MCKVGLEIDVGVLGFLVGGYRVRIQGTFVHFHLNPWGTCCRISENARCAVCGL